LQWLQENRPLLYDTLLTVRNDAATMLAEAEEAKAS
jgi:hypothetical protein